MPIRSAIAAPLTASLRRHCVTLTIVSTLWACSRSPIGPTLSDKEYTGGSSTPAATGGSTAGTSTSGTTISSSGGTTSGASLTCTRTSGHNVYYGKSTVALAYSCGTAVTAVATTNMPSYLSSGMSGQSVTFSGTATDSATAASWSFTANAATTNGDATAITTNTLATSSLTPSMATTVDMSANNNTEVDLNLETALSSSWDGSMSDVSLTAASITTDMQGLSLSSSCTTTTAPYLCNGTQTNSATRTRNADLNLKWRWSAFDQGSYTLNVTPSITIEGGTTSLSTQTMTFTIPIQQSGGNQTLTRTGAVSGFDQMVFTPGLAVNTSSSSATLPYVGLTFQTSSGTNTNYFTRFTVDRTDDPTGGANGITQVTTQLDLTSGSNSRYTRLQAQSSGTWLAVSAKANAISGYDIQMSRISDDAVNATTASLSNATVPVAAFQNASMSAVWLEMTPPFTDSDGTTRFGYAFVRSPDAGTTKRHIVVAKAKPAGTDEATANDDSNFDSIIDASDNAACEIDTNGLDAGTADRLRMAYTTESGTRYFYLAFRKNTDIYVVKIPAAKSASSPCVGLSPQNLTGDLTPKAFANSGEGDMQNISMVLGTKGGATVVGVVWRQSDSVGTPVCYFRRFDQSLTTKSDTLQLSTQTCYQPSLQFSSATGKFLVTYAEKQAATNSYDLKFAEITLGSGTTDTASTPLIVSDLSAVTANKYPAHLETAFYPAGNWMAVFYRLQGTNVLKFHGFHVPGL